MTGEQLADDDAGDDLLKQGGRNGPGLGGSFGGDVELGVGEMAEAKFRVEPLRRTGEDLSTMRARLLCLSLLPLKYYYNPLTPPLQTNPGSAAFSRLTSSCPPSRTPISPL